MLHIELPNGDWVSKYYKDWESPKLNKIKEGVEYDLDFVVNGNYKNITGLREVLTLEKFIEGAKSYGFWYDEDQTWKMAEEMENANSISECEDIVNSYMESWALEEIYQNMGIVSLL